MEIGKDLVKKLYPKRDLWCHKGNFGKLAIVGGSKRYSGSPALAALSAIRAGVDLTLVIAPERPANIIAGFGPDLITHPLKGDYLNPWHLRDVLTQVKGYEALAIGGGTGRERQTLKFVQLFLAKSRGKPCIIDADAIHALSDKKELLVDSPFVVTPHTREFYVLTGKRILGLDFEGKKALVKEQAAKLGTVILVKGHTDIISDGKKLAVNSSGSPYMTKGGTGDTLTGICGALLARGADPFEAACAASYINGKAGELAAKRFGEGLMARDIIDEIAGIIG